MCRKEKNPVDEIINRLKDKYIHVLNGQDVVKISMFTQFVIPALADPKLVDETNQKM